MKLSPLWKPEDFLKFAQVIYKRGQENRGQ